MKALCTALFCIIITTNINAQFLGRLGLSTGSTPTLWSEGHLEYRYTKGHHVTGSFYTNLQNTVIGAQVGSRLTPHINAGIGLGLSDGKIGPLVEAEYCFAKTTKGKYQPYVGAAFTQKFAFIRGGIQFKVKPKKILNFN